MEKNYKVCGVVVTYNRKDLLLRNIESLLAQTYPLDILIYDNASTDGTADYLKEKGMLSLSNVIYVRSDANLGGAGGFCNGEKEALKRNYDYIWLMDDDGYCVNQDTLRNLINKCGSDRQILNSIVVRDIESLAPTFNIGGYTTYAEVTAHSVENELVGVGNPYNATLLPKSCFEEIGFTDSRFFICGDEYDFVARSKKAGYTWKTVTDSLYYHPYNRIILKEFSFFGRKFDVKDQPVWKWYLATRNNIYNSITYNGNRCIIYFWFRVLVVSLYSKDKVWKRLKYGFLGVKDAFSGNFGRPIPFEE